MRTKTFAVQYYPTNLAQKGITHYTDSTRIINKYTNPNDYHTHPRPDNAHNRPKT